MLKRGKKLYLVTANKNHPAYEIADNSNLEIIKYKNEIDFTDLFKKLSEKYHMKRLTVQSGGTVNALLLRAGLIDKVSVVIAPLIVGGKDTSTLVDGDSLHKISELSKIVPLKLQKVTKLKHSYLHLTYKTLKEVSNIQRLNRLSR